MHVIFNYALPGLQAAIAVATGGYVKLAKHQNTGISPAINGTFQYFLEQDVGIAAAAGTTRNTQNASLSRLRVSAHIPEYSLYGASS
jgi:hypothetical protein